MTDNIQDAVAKLGKEIADKVKELGSEKAKTDNTVINMVTEYMQKQQELLAELAKNNKEQGTVPETKKEAEEITGRKDGGFSLEDLEEQERQAQDQNLPLAKRIELAQTKMMLKRSDIAKLHGDAVAEKFEEFKELQDDVYLVGALLAGKMKRPYSEVVKGLNIFQQLQRRVQQDKDLQKALYTGGTGAGAEWIPTMFSSQIMERITLELQVANQFRLVPMPSNPYKFPINSNGATAYLVPEASSDSPSKIPATTPGTGNFEFNAKKLAARLPFSEEMNEDSIVAMIPISRSMLVTAIAEGVENSILNGDDSATHQDTDVTSANDVRKAYKGLRYFGLNNAGTAKLSFGGAAPTTANLRKLRKLMGKYGVNPKNIFWTVGPKIWIEMLDLDEVKTVQNFGTGATVVTGTLPMFDGAPILISEFQREDLNASGVYDGVTTNLGVITLTDKRGFMIGQRLGVTLNAVYDYETDQIILVAKYRLSFKDPYNALDAAHIQTVTGYNILT